MKNSQTHHEFSSHLATQAFSNTPGVLEIDNMSSSYSYNHNRVDYAQGSYDDAVSLQEKQQNAILAGKGPIEVYTIYAERDAKYFANLQALVFEPLKSLNHNILCVENEVTKSNEWRHQNYLLTARLILPLISLSFVASEIWKDPGMRYAIEKHFKNEVRIIPILVQPADIWKQTTLKDLDALPKNGKAISKWRPQEEAYNHIVKYLIETLIDLSFK